MSKLAKADNPAFCPIFDKQCEEIQASPLMCLFSKPFCIDQVGGNNGDRVGSPEGDNP